MSSVKTIAITGAGSGLGAAMARRYAASGWRVGVTDQNLPAAEAVLQQIESSGGNGFAMQLDVTRDHDWLALKQRVMQDWGSLGVLINNAGVAAAGNIEQTSMEDWQWIVDIDLLGVARGCHHFASQFKTQGAGHVVNIASFAAMAGAADIAAYAAAKAGVVALSESMRMEMADCGVGVTVVCPAFVKTNLTDSMRVPDEKYTSRIRRWMENSGVSAEDVAEQVFRAVEQNRFMLLTHGNTRWLWRLKQWAPGWYRRLLRRSGGSPSRKQGSTPGRRVSNE